ncbi:O-antigen ligase family protein [Geodermatophilus sp. SYSU D01186]
MFIFPSDMVIRAVGGQGYVAGLVGLALLALWALAALFNRHDPLLTPHPTRGVLAFLAVMSLVSYAFVPFHRLTETERLSGDRWIMLLAATAGVVLVTAELVPSVGALMRVLRALVLGAAFSGVVAALQWLFRFDLAGLIREAMPGFTLNGDYNTFTARGLLDRVTGTALHPIELGVVAGMVLPIAIALALQQPDKAVLHKWGPVGLVALALPASVSRSAVLSAVVGSFVFALLLPRRQRITALIILPIGALAQFLVRPGYLGTLVGFVSQGEDDPSVATRLNDYALVEQLVSMRPVFGSGGGTYIADNAFDILDNQYLKSLIELGLLGVTGLLAWMLVPALVALAARRRSGDPRLRTLAAALAGSASSGAVCSATFDSLSFNMYAGVHALVVGAIGACWVLASREQSSPQAVFLPQKG